MDRKAVLDAVGFLRDWLDQVIDFSRLNMNECQRANFKLSSGAADQHWLQSCEQHQIIYDQFHSTLNILNDNGYPVPSEWWLSTFEPQVAYVTCSATDEVWLLGTWPYYEPRTPDNVTPKYCIVEAGSFVEATPDEVDVIDGIMDESVVREWESVHKDISETQRRLAELWSDLSVQLTLEEQRQNLCFEMWQAGRAYKEINAELRRRDWQPYPDERRVRRAIEAWAKRLGVTPRKGQRGRPAKA